jgi:hypothetical protein
MFRPTTQLLFALSALAPGALGAQESAPADSQPAASAPVTHTFSLTAHERVTVTLEKGRSYRIELDGRGIRFQLRPSQPGMPSPRIQELLSGQGVAGTTLSLVKPQASGDYFLETVGGDPGRPVRVTLTQEPVRKDDT